MIYHTLTHLTPLGASPQLHSTLYKRNPNPMKPPRKAYKELNGSREPLPPTPDA